MEGGEAPGVFRVLVGPWSCPRQTEAAKNTKKYNILFRVEPVPTHCLTGGRATRRDAAKRSPAAQQHEPPATRSTPHELTPRRQRKKAPDGNPSRVQQKNTFPRTEKPATRRARAAPAPPFFLTLAEQVLHRDRARVADGDVEGSVAVNPRGGLERRAGLDEGGDGGRVAPHRRVVQGVVPVDVLGVPVGPLPQKDRHHLRGEQRGGGWWRG